MRACIQLTSASLYFVLVGCMSTPANTHLTSGTVGFIERSAAYNSILARTTNDRQTLFADNNPARVSCDYVNSETFLPQLGRMSWNSSTLRLVTRW